MEHLYTRDFYFQELLEDIKQKETTLDKLKARYTRLSPDDPSLPESIVGHLREEWTKLIEQLENHMMTRRKFLERARAYHQHHASVNAAIDQIQSEADRVQAMEDAALQERVNLLQVRQRKYV